ncbi:MAG: N-formylglutamate amidohydrolase [Sphingobacteriales bacterium]|nr:MAG: N-formylglutamate amidohydrolase [Sphingobacteriales bacterium]
MDDQPNQSLLIEGDPPPFGITNPGGSSSFLLLGDHAGNRVPTRLGSLGLSDADRVRHIAWDIGIAALGQRLAGELDATFISQSYSRLVIDCNRDPSSDDAMPFISDGTAVAANQRLDATERAARIEAIHTPYHAAIAAELARRDAADRKTLLVALHSFTPSLLGEDRPWHIGILYGGGDEHFARTVLSLLVGLGEFPVGNNQPYAMDDTDYGVPRHAFAARRPYVEIEIRQDLLATDVHIDGWTDVLARILVAAAGRTPG